MHTPRVLQQDNRCATVADGDDVGLLFNSGGPDSLRWSVVADNAAPLLHLERARFRNYRGRTAPMLAVGYFELPDFDPLAGDVLTFTVGRPAIKVWNYQITCSTPERCTGLTTPTIGLNRISIWRSGAGWRFIVQSLSNFGLLRDALVLNLELCGGEFFNQFCLSGRYPLESVGHTRRYRSPNR